jgi:hypothetical protein
VPGQQQRRIGSDLGKFRRAAGFPEAVKSQNLREGPIDLQPARDALMGKTMSIACVPLLKRIDVGPARNKIEDRRVLRGREDLHAQEPGHPVDEVRPIEKRLVDRGLQTVFDAEAGNYLDHRGTVSEAGRLGRVQVRPLGAFAATAYRARDALAAVQSGPKVDREAELSCQPSILGYESR